MQILMIGRIAVGLTLWKGKYAMNGMGNCKWSFTLKWLRGFVLAEGLAGCGLAGSALGAEPGSEGYLLKWYGWADVSAMPPLQTYYCYEGDALRTLCDGTASGAEFSGGPEVGARPVP